MHRGKLQPTALFLSGESLGQGAWWATAHWVTEIGHDRVINTHTHTHTHTHYTVETNTTLLSNHSPIKNKFKKSTHKIGFISIY